MAVFTDAAALKRKIRQRAERGSRSLETATGDVAQEALRIARTLSEGTKTTKQLRQAGHPYAVRHGIAGRAGKAAGGRAATFAAYPLLPINRQKGRLHRGWRVFRYRRGKDTVFRVQNVAPHSKFVLSLDGTKYVKSRRFYPELHRRVRPYARRHTLKAIKNAQR